jgi:hypothetical protein
MKFFDVFCIRRQNYGRLCYFNDGLTHGRCCCRYPVSPTEERYLADIARYQDTEEWADKGEDALKAHIKKLHKRRMKTKEAKDNKNAADAQVRTISNSTL